MADDYFSIKGFASYGALVNNQPNVTSPIGELSLRSGTFSKDRTHYSGTTDTSPTSTANVTVFSCRDKTGVDQPVPALISSLLIDISKWSYKQSVDGVFNAVSDSYKDAFLAEYGSKVTNITVGMMVTNGTIWLPAYITVYYNTDVIYGGNVPAGQEILRSRIWFSDTDFQQQYDEYDIAFIPPITPVDDLFGNPLTVANRLAQRTPPELIALVNEAEGNTPSTVVRSFNFRYHHLGNPLQTSPAYWTFVVWSDYGDNIDTLKKELAEWLLSQSTHTREEWAEIFPDIFSSTEVIITPLWNQIAIPNLTIDYAMYSPTVSIEDAKTFVHATATGTGYTPAHVDANSTFLSMPFKSIACLAVGGPENRNGMYKLTDIIPDYLAVPPSSTDFDRMSAETRHWSYMMLAMLSAAETMGEFTDVPPGMSRLRRTNAEGDEILYLVSNINDVQYLVVSKLSLNALYPPIDRTANPIVFTPDPSVVLTTPLGSKRLLLNVSVTGGTAPYTYSATSGDIEAGGEIDPITGFLDVTFREWGTNHIDVTVQDSRGFPSVANYTVISNET